MPADSEEVTNKKKKKMVFKFLRMKYQLYDDINKLRKKYCLEPLKVNKTQSIQLQKYVKKFINDDKDLKPLKTPLEEIYNFCYPGNDYDPIKNGLKKDIY
uniref:Uncharacterized protein n=1 Tax=Strongyloides venezuelensis TaxID=75913 RepID=A0A0K0EZW6_STRVS